MCGIAGVTSLGGSLDAAVVRSMLACMTNRGPDAEGMYEDDRIVLGHRRLSILDISPSGNQPLTNESCTVWLVANGEVYNHAELRSDLTAAGHRFRSRSDSEIIVHGYEEWGIDGLLSRMAGMFAFGLYDSAARGCDGPVLYLVRDRLGIKPLYYAENQERLLFASEVKALERVGAGGGVDVGAAIGFLCLGSVPSPRTWLRGIRAVPAGHFLSIQQGRSRLTRYWAPGSRESGEGKPLRSVLERVVQRHLVADVPVGVFLSGGVDSAAIAALSRTATDGPIRSLTVTFDEAQFDEGREAREIARGFGLDHHEVHLTDREFMAEIPAFLAAMDQPTADGANTYFVSRAAKQRGLTVVLSGLGGDEVFLGYPHYRKMAYAGGWIDRYGKVPDPLRRQLNGLVGLYGRMRGQERWERFDYLAGRPLHEGLYLLFRGFFPPRHVARLLGVEERQVARTLEEALGMSRRAPEAGRVDIERFQAMEIERYLHDQLLRDSDVFSMAHSLELRVPFLDHEVVEEVAKIPRSQKTSPAMNKPVLAKAVGHPLVDLAARRPKRGFSFPFGVWMRRNAGSLEERANAGGLFDRNVVREVWRSFRDGRLHWSRAWATVTAAAARK